MSDTDSARGNLLLTVKPVVESLAALRSTTTPLMVVGAACRDALHAAMGHATQLRATDDLDLALAVAGWSEFNQLTAGLDRIGTASSSIRFLIENVKVDLVPFGAPIEDRDGMVTPATRGEPMDVFGFQEVYDAADELSLGDVCKVRLPTVAGYTLLKLKAWVDRSADGNTKDGSDLACALFWYQNSATVADRLYDDPRDRDHLLVTDWDPNLGAVRLLIRDALDLLPDGRREQLRSAWPDQSRDRLLETALANERLPLWPPSGDDRLAHYVAAIRDVLVNEQ